MIITVDISFYPLRDIYDKPVYDFIDAIAADKRVVTEPGTMSTLITGEYEVVMSLLNEKMRSFMEKYPSVFTIKISNSCEIPGQE